MKIAIDPGHGMSNRRKGVYDPGATHTENGIAHEEAAIALQYALTLRDSLRARSHEVFLTRDSATAHAPVGQRARTAEDAGAQLFVSLHLNDCDNDTANGLEVLYRDEADRPLAQALQTTLQKVTGFKDRKVKQRTDLAVLKFNGPAVLIELGFIANDANRATLLNPQQCQTICNAITDVLVSYPKQWEAVHSQFR